ncbi:MAG: AAA family ATPase [Deltaproteobacteria bacterium]|jgi:DNA repair protein SbcC/Rad50|nr:AAA family ATPase [Deltaproteobacteria bacterium]MBT4525493.1 AAA family ATPase [Deltaproteobacteria bacterium]
MKILELRFKNLNSLYGEWSIDFKTPEYETSGIFALTGPTGAGKSTILDAICLALYGTTPRLGKISKSGNEIMSRQTGECFAEVIFESQAGKFRCHWSQHKARRKAEGNLVEAKHELAEADSGKILESKKKDVANVIEEKTGMDFERFTRSILLAQGGFDTFLKANTEQKSKTLEQITGTEIYTEISKRVHERQKAENDKLNLLKAETSGIIILTEEKETEITGEVTVKQKLEKEIANKVQETGKSITWLMATNNLRKEVAAISEETVKLNTTLKLFEPEQKKLDLALKAAELDSDWAKLISARKQKEEDQNALKTEEEQLPAFEASNQKKEALFKETDKLIIQARERQKSHQPLIQKIRTLDQQILDKNKLTKDAKANCNQLTRQISIEKTKLEKTELKYKSAQKDWKQAQNYLHTHARDESLVTQFAGIEEQIRNIQSIQQDIIEKSALLQSTEQQLILTTKTLSNHSQDLAKNQKALKESEQQVFNKKTELTNLLENRLLREYQAEKDSLLREMVFLKTIANLESERTKLEDSQPCPLCGSEKHPYAEGNIPEPDDTEKRINKLTMVIQKAEVINTNIKELEVLEKDISKKVIAAEKLVVDASNDTSNAEKSKNEAALALDKVKERYIQQKATTLINLQPLGINEIVEKDVPSLISKLKSRLKKWQHHYQNKEKIEKEGSEIKIVMQRLDGIVKTQNQSLVDKQNVLNTLKKEYEGQKTERYEQFSDKKPDIEEANLAKVVSEAELAISNARAERDKTKELLHSVKANIASLKKRILKITTELQSLETNFMTHLANTDFQDEQSFVKDRLSAQERNLLLKQSKKLDQKKTEIQARRKDRENLLNLELEKKVSESSLEVLEPLNKEFEKNLKETRDVIAGLKQKLIDNNAAKDKIKEKQGQIDKQRQEYHKWGKLHKYIGSADGKKYRNFAQGLTFELMVSHANLQLGKMTDRYLLMRDDNEPLELNVIDNYQAGEIRSIKNLSGGESFIVSLSLALGLSKMASRKVRVDSLFLDEGFGTLDDDALETALETLSGLQQDGKLIGVISHVPTLKDRISTQINVLPISGGKSTINGPGCQRII